MLLTTMLKLEGKLCGSHADSVLCVSGSRDEAKVASGGENGELTLWDLATQSTIGKCSGIPGENDVNSVLWAKDSSSLLYASSGNVIYQYDTRDLSTPASQLQVNEEEINQIDINAAGNHLASCDDSGQVKIVDLQGQRVLKTLRKHSNICAAVKFSTHNAAHVLTGGYDNYMVLWDYMRLKQLSLQNMQDYKAVQNPNASYMINPPFVHSIATVNAEKINIVANGCENGTIQLFESRNRGIEHLITIQGHTQGVSQVLFMEHPESGQPPFLCSGGNDSTIHLWDVHDICTLEAEKHHMEAKKSRRAKPRVKSHRKTSAPKSADVASHEPLEETEDETKEAVCTASYSQNHGHKVNWMDSIRLGDQTHLLVADETNVITFYKSCVA
ncbi:unnamed protein product [Owenia fusiformis]|uniref:Uncharacterized protein n=1 Tax=Owenia fusiformis TaxID=6347 RepID=A0A8S4NLG5_OWEFU|nr:unnamed protein product [Owenia fusiformis]